MQSYNYISNDKTEIEKINRKIKFLREEIDVLEEQIVELEEQLNDIEDYAILDTTYNLSQIKTWLECQDIGTIRIEALKTNYGQWALKAIKGVCKYSEDTLKTIFSEEHASVVNSTFWKSKMEAEITGYRADLTKTESQWTFEIDKVQITKTVKEKTRTTVVTEWIKLTEELRQQLIEHDSFKES